MSTSKPPPRSPIKLKGNTGKPSTEIFQASTTDVENAKVDEVLRQKDHLAVVTCDDFFQTVFPSIELTSEEQERMDKNKRAFSYVKLGKLKNEPALSVAVTKGINRCCPPTSNDRELRYFDTHIRAGKNAEPQPGVEVSQTPDGFVTWKWTTERENEDDAYRQFDTFIQTGTTERRVQKWLLTPISKNPGILFEHKISPNDDIDLAVGQKGNLTDAQAKLWLQKFGYIMSQWAYCEPHRYLISVTLTGQYMRFWASGPSGTIASERFNYLTNARPLFKLLHLYAKSNGGYDVGENATFQSIPPDQLTAVNECCQKIAKAYASEAHNPTWLEDWNKRLKHRPEGAAWLFNVEKHTKLDLRNTAPTTSPSEESTSTFIAAPKHAVVLSVPISHNYRMASRGTRCYLAFDWALVGSDRLNRPADIMKHVRSLKTSWVSTVRTEEYRFYQKVMDRRTSETGPFFLATALAGGCFEDSAQNFIATRVVPAFRPKYDRRINWLLMKEVGRDLGTFTDGNELTQVIHDIAITLKTLSQFKILHRDISVNNVLIDVVERRGLLIDLDLALDLAETPTESRPAITGTDYFISIAFDNDGGPRHTFLHDLESLYWTALYIAIRHKPDVQVEISDRIFRLADARSRSSCLQRIFPKGRLEFLERGTLLGQDIALKNYINSLGGVYRSVYSLVAHVDRYMRRLLNTVLNTVLDSDLKMELAAVLPQLQTYSNEDLYELTTKDALQEHVEELLKCGKRLESIPLDDDLGFTTEELGEISARRTEVESMLSQIRFPDFETCIQVLNKALVDSKRKPGAGAIPYSPPRRTQPKEQLRHGVGKTTSMSHQELVRSTSRKRTIAESIGTSENTNVDEATSGNRSEGDDRGGKRLKRR